MLEKTRGIVCGDFSGFAKCRSAIVRRLERIRRDTAVYIAPEAPLRVITAASVCLAAGRMDHCSKNIINFEFKMFSRFSYNAWHNRFQDSCWITSALNNYYWLHASGNLNSLQLDLLSILNTCCALSQRKWSERDSFHTKIILTVFYVNIFFFISVNLQIFFCIKNNNCNKNY